ncbi:MAG: hypothetical protein LUC44_04975 [Prevotellaceae bacterium]|nr:hypothetical protein [Prevotellaceae bacterium]
MEQRDDQTTTAPKDKSDIIAFGEQATQGKSLGKVELNSDNRLPLSWRNGSAGRGLTARGCGQDQCQLNVHDYMADLPDNTAVCDLVEVQFKNTRKGYYHNDSHLDLKKGDMVAVEAAPGHDIGVVTMTGRLVELQLKKAQLKADTELKRIYRIAREIDLEKYEEAKGREHETMIESRQIAKDLGLEMKIGDVEYQGDGQKAIFYYIADGRVDFRQLIKELAAAFHVRIEMKQIGARQEAGRIGGFGPCGRELCCSTWLRNFHSVNTSAARLQDLTLNPQKMAGQCAKLRCCMNYEVDQYIEASRRLPSREVELETEEKTYHLMKADILSGEVTYSTDRKRAENLVTISSERATEVIAMNRDGVKPHSLTEDTDPEHTNKSLDLATQEDVNRFDRKKKKKKKNRKNDPSSTAATEQNRVSRGSTDSRKNK